MLSVVLDSSVLVSGFLTEGGTTATLLSRYRQGAFALCSSPWIVEETERALLRPRNINRYRYRPEDVRQFLDGLARSAQFFRDASQAAAVTRDPSDDQVIACAVAARADYLVRAIATCWCSPSIRAFGSSRRASFSMSSKLRAAARAYPETAPCPVPDAAAHLRAGDVAKGGSR
jgi:uncharacterized protein